MTLLEILTGKGGYYPGLVPLVLVYLDSIGCDPDTASRVQAYVDLIVKRASGELQTAAAWQREDFVRQHRRLQEGLCGVSDDRQRSTAAVPFYERVATSTSRRCSARTS